MSNIQFIGGEKGGVGKSVIARLLTQYFIDKGKPFTALDADASHGALTRFYTDYSQPVSLNDVEDTDRIIQLAVDDNQTILVDLPSQSRNTLNAWLKDNDILSLASENNIGVTFWHVMDDGMDGIKLLEKTLTDAFDHANYVIVKNFGRGEDFSAFEGSQVEQDALNSGAKIISIKQLLSSTMRKIDRLNYSYWAAANNSDTAAGECLNLLERHRVKAWLKDSYNQLEFALS